jgi:hypothetical protein
VSDVKQDAASQSGSSSPSLLSKVISTCADIALGPALLNNVEKYNPSTLVREAVPFVQQLLSLFL